MIMNSIEVQGLTKQYRTQKHAKAIEDLSFSIPEGQLFGLIGPDGAGKTTTLRILSTVMEPTGGSAMVAGYDIRKQANKIRPLIGYMPQNFSLYPDLSVIENLNFFADLNNVRGNGQPGNAVNGKNGFPGREERMKEMLAFTRLDRFQSRRAANLSGGMKKKLALACALIHSPKVLLLDEPSTGVDPVSRRELWVMLAEVVAQGVTVIVSTPYMDEADRCSKVGILYQGQLLRLGSPDELQMDLPYEIIEVKAKPRKKMRQVVGNLEGVSDWRPVGDRLRISVPHENGTAKKLMRRLNRGLRLENASVQILRSAKKTMEDVFTHSVHEKRSEL
jgi:ABC-2 type transport system ATP-binding protein